MAITAQQEEANRLRKAGLISDAEYKRMYHTGTADPTRLSDKLQKEYGIGKYAQLREYGTSEGLNIDWDPNTRNVTFGSSVYTPEELTDMGGTLSHDRWVLPQTTLADLLKKERPDPIVPLYPSAPMDPGYTRPVEPKKIVTDEPVKTQPDPVTPEPKPVVPVNTTVIRGQQTTGGSKTPTNMGALKMNDGVDSERARINEAFDMTQTTTEPASGLDTLKPKKKRSATLDSLMSGQPQRLFRRR